MRNLLIFITASIISAHLSILEMFLCQPELETKHGGHQGGLITARALQKMRIVKKKKIQ